MSFVVIKHQGKSGRVSDIGVAKLTENELYEFKEDHGQVENLAPDHPLNTDAYKKKLQIADDVTCFAFYNYED